VTGLWGQLATGEDAATFASGLFNAVAFARRVRDASGPRRIAAAVLIALTAGSAADALLHATLEAPAAPTEVALRFPLLLGNLAVLALIVTRARS
jgi:hypothetical protein